MSHFKHLSRLTHYVYEWVTFSTGLSTNVVNKLPGYHGIIISYYPNWLPHRCNALCICWAYYLKYMRHWHVALTRGTDTRHWHVALTRGTDTWHWRKALTRGTHLLVRQNSEGFVAEGENSRPSPRHLQINIVVVRRHQWKLTTQHHGWDRCKVYLSGLIQVSRHTTIAFFLVVTKCIFYWLYIIYIYIYIYTPGYIYIYTHIHMSEVNITSLHPCCISLMYPYNVIWRHCLLHMMQQTWLVTEILSQPHFYSFTVGFFLLCIKLLALHM